MAGDVAQGKLPRREGEQNFFSRLACGAFLLVSLLLSSCATPYRPLNHHYGYSEQQVSDDVYEVSFLANANSSYRRAFDFALLRAAEIALARHARSFALLDVVNLSSARAYQSPGYYYWTASPYLSTGGRTVPAAPEFVGGLDRSYLMFSPPEDRIYYRPGVKLKVKLLADPPGRYYPYDPATESERLKRKYRIKSE